MYYRNFHTYLLLFLLISGNHCLFGQDSTKIVSNFPKSWVGNWVGDLSIYGPEGVKQTIPMELQVRPLEGSSNYDWWIIYGEDKEKGKRAYELHPKDPKNGIWVVDEKNTIVLECYYFHDKLFSSYEVAGSLLLVTYEVHGDEMTFEVIAGNSEPVSVTGGEKFEEEDIPEVKAFPINVMQRAKMIRE